MMQVCVNNNTLSEQWTPKAVRPKRDFRFQVIEVPQGPKWFVWPSRNSGCRPSSSSSDENHNRTSCDTAPRPAPSDVTYAAQSFPTVNPAPVASQNGYGSMRRSLAKIQHRRKMEEEGCLAPCGTPTCGSPTVSPSMTPQLEHRRLSAKKDKALTEPITVNAPSSTFQIISICKKWESIDATDDELDDEIDHLSIQEAERRWSAQ